MTTKSGKHANKTSGSAKDKAAKAVDMRKVAALSAGAAGVIAGAAIAFGATPAMAADATSASVKTNDPAKEQNLVDANKGNSKTSDDSKATKKNEASKDETPNSEVKKEAKKEESKEAKEEPKKEQTKPAEQAVAKTDGNTDVTKTEAGSKVESIASVDNQDAKQDSEETGTPAGSVVNKRTRRSLDEKKQPEPTKDTQAEKQDRAEGDTASQDPNKINPDTSDSTNTKIEVNENNAGTMPNMYGWGSSDNTYSINGETHTVTFNFAKPKDGTITAIAIFPAQNNGLNNDKSKRGAEYYSGDPKMHQSFSGNYTFKTNGDGSATLTMSDLFRDGNLNGGAEAYAANRSIFVYVTKDGNTTVYKTNAFRAATLVPPKTSGSIVLKYNQPLTKEQIKAAITAAANAETARKDKKSVNDQIIAASKANGVNTTVNGKSTQVPDTLTDKINASSADAYDAKQFDAINTKKTGDTNSYVAGAKTLNTYMVTDLGFKSEAIPLTVARYDDRIDKPIVEDPTKVSAEIKEEIAKKLAKINGVSTDKITFDADGNAVIHFDGVDEKDAPKIALKDLVLKKLEEKDVTVPSDAENSTVKAVIVANPLGYSNAELKQIKKAIYEANKDNQELGLSANDYENQISLEYLTGNLTAAGKANQGISNGQAENTITVKIKTDKAVAEFTSDVKQGKLTRLPDIRKDYTVSWTKDKIDKRDTDEGFSWSEDKKTIIYRYDSTKAEEFDTNKILDLLKATPKDKSSGLRDLTGNEKLDHEGVDGKPQKSHVGYVLNGDEPTTELSLGKMDGAYWKYSRQVDNSGVDLGNEESNAGSYSWDKDAKPVVVAAKQDKVYKARLFVLPYGLTMYRNVYMENGNQPWNTPKAINVIFVPQTNHKIKDLKKSVGEHATTQVDGKDVPTQHEYYNASDDKKAAYDEALKKANDALKEAGNTEDSKLSEELKARIDNATIRLDKARAALDGAKTDKSKLEQDIKDQGNPKKDNTAASGTYETDKYKNVTVPSFLKDDGKLDTDKNSKASAAKTAYDEALTEAEKVKADANATQKAVDAAKAKLDAARKELDKYSTNKDKLNAAIAEHGQVNTGDATKTGDDKLKTADPTYQNSEEKERKAYDDAVKKANELSKDPNASQKDVNDAITALETAKKALDAKATNKAKLAAAVQQTFDNPEPDNVNGKKSTFYQNAKAKSESTDPNVTADQKTAAANAYKAYDEALKKAKEVLADANGKATQAQVDAAVQALTDAEDKLHNYSTDKNDLTKALADNIDGYLKPAYFNAFDKAQAGDDAAKKAFKEYNDAYHAAKALKEKFAKTNPAEQPSDEECKTAKEALDKARQVIDTYATDTKKLSAAFWNDLAIQNSPAYKNAKALVDKTNPTDDEKAKVEAAKKIKKAYDDAVAKLHKAFSNTLDKDKNAQDAKIPDAKGDPTSKNYLDGIQRHANGEPLDRDVTEILTAMNDAADQLKQFATKTDKLQESINKDTDTQKDPAYKNARDPHKLDTDGKEDTSGYDAIKEKAKAYDDALKDAKALMIKPDATQEDVNAALKKLDDARKALEVYKTNVEDLKKSVEAHGSTDGPATKEGTVTSDAYRNASDPHFMKEEGGKLVPDKDKNTNAAAAKKAYDEALTKAQELLKKHGDKDTPQDAKPTQKEIDAALTTLNEKRQALDAYKTDTSKLDEEAKKSTAEGVTVAGADFEAKPEFKNAKAKTSNGVENADVTAYKNALKNARDLVKAATSTDPNTKNSERPTQQQVDEALASLKKAKKQIEDNYKTDTSKLEEAKKYAEDVFKKTPEYKNALAKKEAGDQTAISHLGKDGEKTGFDNVLKKVIDNLKDNDWKGKTTQKFVDKLLEKLQEAQDNITKNYKTNVTPLSNEVGDKDQDGKPVIPPFEESIPYKNALEKKNAGDNDATTKLKDYNDKLAAAQKIIDQVNKPDPNAAADSKPTQAQVDAALKALQDAKKAIDDSFGTKIDDLKTEAAKSTADGGTVADVDFEATTEFKNADAKKGEGGKENADVTAYKEALKKARALLNKFDANGKPKSDAKDVPTQKEVDEALKNLKEIKDKITKNYVTSPHDLQQEVDKSKDGDTDTSTDVFENTPEFKNAAAKGDEAAKNALEDYKKALDDAKALLDKFERSTGKPKTLKAGEKAPTQKQLDDALDALKVAKKKITDGYKTNKSDLNTEAGKDSDFTKSPEYQNAQAKGDDASKQALEDYKKALEDANKVLGDKNATQAQVDEALKKLQDAKSKLSDGYKTDKSDLTAEAGKDSDFTKSPEYQNAAGSPEADAYKRALDEANRILGDKNATQADVDAALRKLQDAKSKLVDSHKTDKSDLNTEAGKDSDFRKSIPFIIGKAADLAEYQQALNDADSVLKDPNATQAQVDQALRRLRDAKQKLIDSYNRLINSGSGVGSGSDHDFGTDTDVNTGVGVNDVNNTSVNNVVDKGALQAEVDAALGDVSANANGVVADSNLVSEFNAALNYARLVLADANATQGQVDSALARLRAARAALRAGMLAARNSAGMNLKRGDVSGVNTGASSSVFAALAAVFAGLGVVGAASKRRKHSAR